MVRMFRGQRGWSQETLAVFSGLQPRTVQRVEAGERSSATRGAQWLVHSNWRTWIFSTAQSIYPPPSNSRRKGPTSERTHLTLDAREVDGRGLAAIVSDLGDFGAVGSSGLADLPPKVQDGFAAILDCTRDLMDVRDVAGRAEMLGYGDDLNAQVAAMAAEGYALLAATRKAAAEGAAGRQADVPPRHRLPARRAEVVQGQKGGRAEGDVRSAVMAKPLSQAMLDRKREKARDTMSRQIAGWSPPPFGTFKHRPTEDDMLSMFLAARFGPGDPLTAGGDDFAVEYLLDELWINLRDVDSILLAGKGTYMDPDGTGMRTVSAQDELWGNLLFVLDVDIDLARHWAKLEVEDFEVVVTASGVVDYLVERESRAFGLSLGCDTLVPVREAIERWGDPLKFNPSFAPNPFKADDKLTVYHVTVGPLDRLLTPEERAVHGVVGFERKLASGLSVPVRPHVRRNPRALRGRGTNLDEVAFCVYRAFDLDGRVRYYGEGTADRPGHVNSGASHNFKLNEHFFRRGPMRVEVFARGLSKDEARSVERLCIRGHTGPHELWNVKDYEATRPADSS